MLIQFKYDFILISSFYSQKHKLYYSYVYMDSKMQKCRFIRLRMNHNANKTYNQLMWSKACISNSKSLEHQFLEFWFNDEKKFIKIIINN